MRRRRRALLACAIRDRDRRLAAGAAYQRGGLVFTDELGAAISPDRVSAAFRRLAKVAGLPPLTLHGLRHTFATVGLDAGVDVLYIAELLGHSSPAITMNVYQHVRRGTASPARRAPSRRLLAGEWAPNGRHLP